MDPTLHKIMILDLTPETKYGSFPPEQYGSDPREKNVDSDLTPEKNTDPYPS